VLIFIYTGGSHINLTGDYTAIPKEMRGVAKELAKNYLSETNYETFLQSIKLLRNQISDRSILRAYHFFKENERVIKQINALSENDFKKFLSLVNESGDSSFKYLKS